MIGTAPRRAAARPSTRARSGGATLSTDQRLARISDRLDALVRDASVGAHSAREFERQVGEAEAIAAELRAVFRSPASAANPSQSPSSAGEPRPVHPPLFHQDGKAVW